MTSRGVHEARSIAGSVARALPAERIALEKCLARQLASEVVATMDIPHFDSSAMDGWVVSGEGPWCLTHGPLSPGTASEIVTGALVPDVGDAVLRSESGCVSDGTLSSSKASEPIPGQHIRRRGSEAMAGDLLIAAGVHLNPAHLALAASAGIDELTVAAEPHLAIVVTGDELVTEGNPGPGAVRDAFGISLPHVFGQMGASVREVLHVGDAIGPTIAAIESAGADLIVTTGGTGNSSADTVRDALIALGAEFLIESLALRPGRPTVLARLKDDRLVLCLPGNPLAAIVAAIVVGEPLVAALAGRPPRPIRHVPGVEITGRPGAPRAMPYAVSGGRAAHTGWQGAGMLRGLAVADGLMIIPEEGLADGDPVESFDLPWMYPSAPRLVR